MEAEGEASPCQSTASSPSHCMARSNLSSRATVIIQNVFLTLALARRAPWPRWRIASATEMYEIHHSSLSMKSFMLYPSEAERSTINSYFTRLMEVGACCITARLMLSEHAHQVEKVVSCDSLPGGRKFLQYLHPVSQAFQSLNGTAQASPYYYKILNLHLPLTGLSHYTPDCLCYPYPYMHRLEGLRACIPTVAPQVLQAITTSLDLCKWQSELQGNQHTLN